VKTPVKPNFKIRSQQSIFHHLFKALQSKFMKNLAFGDQEMRLDFVEHVHHYHNVNSMGHAQKYTTTIGGHFHEVTWSLDAKTGEPVAKCGPALKKLVKNSPRGTKTVIEPLKFFNKDEQQWIVDDHKHEMEYKGTDEISTANIQEIQRQNATMLQSVEPKKTIEADIVDSDR
jgi:hypothetical protein